MSRVQTHIYKSLDAIDRASIQEVPCPINIDSEVILATIGMIQRRKVHDQLRTLGGFNKRISVQQISVYNCSTGKTPLRNANQNLDLAVFLVRQITKQVLSQTT